MKVLVVDDDHNVCNLLAKRFDCQTAASIDEGLALARKDSPDVILLDVRFDGPGMTGIDAISEFKAAAPAAKIVVFTALPDSYECKKALEAGAYRYVGKRDAATACASALPRLVKQSPQPAPVERQDPTVPGRKVRIVG